MSAAQFRALARRAAARYPARDRFARHFAYGKLTRDPAFRYIVAHGLVAEGARLLDLGCGQGVLAALLAASRERGAEGDWPRAWPGPPRTASLRGIDLRALDVERARHAVPEAEFVHGDIRTASFGTADVVVILDVLHYIDFAAQREVLGRVRDALAGGGTLLLRVGDAAGTLRFRITDAVDRAVMAFRGHKLERLYCRPVAQWREELASLGFAVDAVPMSEGTPFANVLLRARYDAR